MAYKVKIYSFTKTGELLADKICGIENNIFRCEKLLFEKEENNRITEELFYKNDAHVFIGATGIAVRKIAPFVADKKTDPAVIAIDEKGEFIIPILSGHMGGANELAKLIADNLNGTPVITTATDVNNINAIDKIVSERRLTMLPSNAANVINPKLLKGEKIKVFIDRDIEVVKDTFGIYELSSEANCDVIIKNITKYIIGVGCRKNTDISVFENVLNSTLNKNGISHNEIDRIVSIELKSEEKAILSYADKYKIMFETYSKDELNSVCGEFDESDFVKEVTGVSNVSERACVYAGNMLGRGEYVLKRKAIDGITISIYKVTKRIDLNGKA